MPATEDRFVGCLLGLALGDALAAPYEFGGLGWFFQKAARGKADQLLEWTDDTQMALVLAERLAEDGGVDADRLALAWARAADPSRGYGEGALKLLELIAGGEDWRKANRYIFPKGSWGNGAAMRAAPLGLFYHRDEPELERAARAAAEITHAHPLGVEGGVLIARAAARALQEPFEPDSFLAGLGERCVEREFVRRLASARACLRAQTSAARARELLGNRVAAHQSAVTAVYAFCRHPDDFEALLRLVVGIGGDTDTIGAMAGALFGARNGAAALPEKALANLEERARLERVARGLWSACAR